jgi:protein-S-isoprenylcysteine O-methyltransferase Ste14
MEMTVAAVPPRRTLMKGRARHTWIFALIVVPFLLLSQSMWVEGGLIHEGLEWIGYFALILCVLGRAWCAAYIGGRKNQAVVTSGPYSIVRNPLYVFSFFGVLGVGLSTGTVAMPALLAMTFAIYYAQVVRREERFLIDNLGPDYVEYMHRVPRWIPRLALWFERDEIVVRPRFVLLTIRDSAWFFIALPVLELVDTLHQLGWLPVYFWLP